MKGIGVAFAWTVTGYVACVLVILFPRGKAMSKRIWLGWALAILALLAVTLFMSRFLWPCFFDITFFQQLVTTFLGVGIGAIVGIPVGLALNRLTTSKNLQDQRTQLKQALKKSLERNRGYLKTLEEAINNESAPTFSLDVALLGAVVQLKYEVLDDVTLCASLDHIHFELAHLARLADALMELELDPMAKVNLVPKPSADGPDKSHYALYKPQLRKNMLDQLKALRGEIDAAIAKLV